VSDEGLLNKHQRKKARRKARKQSERQAHRDLDSVTTEAVDEALRLAPIVVHSNERSDQVRAIDVPLASLSEAQFIRKRVNEALRVDEWLDDVSIEIWTPSELGSALTDRGGEQSLELRMRRTIA
jgi:hypothetical protein